MLKEKKQHSKDFIFINLIYYPIKVLGPGIRIGLWTQGCTIRCAGCSADYAWEFSEKYKTKTKEAAKAVLKYSAASKCRALTISGGEPFDQPEALEKLITLLKNGGINDIMIYSGYSYDILKKEHQAILNKIDVLIDSPFIKGDPSRNHWSGSANQRLIILTKNDKLIKEYENFVTAVPADECGTIKRSLQIIIHNDKIYIAGIGDQADIESLKSDFGSI